MSVPYSQKEVSAEKIARNWSKLSSAALETIYAFLNRSDQFNMSMVCGMWSEAYGFPSVWKNFVFAKTETCPGLRLGWKYSNLFRNLKICSCSAENVCTSSSNLTAFLHHITSNSQLVSVKFGKLRHCKNSEDSTSDDLKTAVGNFLGSQRRLKKLEFNTLFAQLGDYIDVLKQLNENSKDTIQYLRLGNLSYCKHLEENQDLDTGLLSLEGLHQLSYCLKTLIGLEYSLIFEDASQFPPIKSNYSQRLVLSTIIIRFDNAASEPGSYEVLKSFDWRILTKLYPHLQVELTITNYSPLRQHIECFIAPYMPITRLVYEYMNTTISNPLNPPLSVSVLSCLFRRLYLCKTSDHLVSLSFVWHQRIPDFWIAVNLFVLFLKKLKSLKLSMESPGIDLCKLLKIWFEKGTQSLENVSMLISGEREPTALMKSADQYVIRLKDKGINVNIRFKA